MRAATLLRVRSRDKRDRRALLARSLDASTTSRAIAFDLFERFVSQPVGEGPTAPNRTDAQARNGQHRERRECGAVRVRAVERADKWNQADEYRRHVQLAS